MKKVTKADLLKKIETLEIKHGSLRKEFEQLSRDIENLKWFVNLSDDPEKLNEALEFAQKILCVIEHRRDLKE